MNRKERRAKEAEDKKMKTVQVGRLAFRHEGRMWNAYFADTDSMKDAILIGSIAMRLVEDETRMKAFMDLMNECFCDICEETLGVRPKMPGAVPAPEHERGGHA